MANLLNANLPSDDEEDDDFVPDEVDSEDEAVRKQKAKKPKKRVRGSAAAAGEGEASSEDDEDEAPPAEKIIPESKRLEKKAKVDEMWSMLNAPKPSAGKPPAAASGASSLAALSKPAPKQGGASAGDALLRQLGLGGGKPRPAPGAAAVDRKAVAGAALAAAKAAASMTAGQQFGMVTVTETRRFAGQNITVQREVQAGPAPSGRAPAAAAATAPGAPSAAGGDAAPSAAAAAQKKAGLDAVLESLAQAKKVSVLDKTRSDWREFKRSDDAVEEELEAHKRSGAAFLERQAFLSRAELAEYERERDQRLGSNMRSRGRL